jgi:hypothetical protein
MTKPIPGKPLRIEIVVNRRSSAANMGVALWAESSQGR